MKTPQQPTQELGVSGQHLNTGIPNDEFLPELNGIRGIKKYREMRDNDPVIGAILHAMEMMIRGVDWTTEPADDSPQAEEKAEWLDTVWNDMTGTWDEFITQSLSMFPFGFSVFEPVYKRRNGPSSNARKSSAYDDGSIGLMKLAHRAQTTFYQWKVNEYGEVIGFVQQPPAGGRTVTIPIEKMVYFRTTTINDSPMGRSVLRNAYRPYYYASHIENIEGIAIERELNGLPVFRVPSSVMKDQTKLSKYEEIARDVKRNEQGYMILPSDMWTDEDGNLSGQRMVEFELLASQGSRDIDTDKSIMRYRMDIARTVLADFVMLGQGDRGSFALSRDKSDLFLSSLEGYLEMIASTVNRQLVSQLWALNGFDPDLRPEMTPGKVAPIDLGELGEYINRVAGAGAPIFPDNTIEEALLEAAGLPVNHREDSDMVGRPAAPTETPNPEDEFDGAS